jgi:anti-sigma factor RsiW
VPPGVEEGPRTLTLQGFHLIHWAKNGSTFWVISDLNEAELEEFVRLIQGQAGGS